MDYVDDDVRPACSSAGGGRSSHVTISAPPLRLRAIGAISLTLAVGPQVLVLPPTIGRTVARPEGITLPAIGASRQASPSSAIQASKSRRLYRSLRPTAGSTSG